ncbi:MAG: iron(III) transport system ATP-binding protein [Planctomycetota bacterium]
MNGCTIEISALEVAIDGKTILGPLDLTINAGEYVCVLGHSGSGKSTLLRTIAGLQIPQGGTVTLGDSQATGPGRVIIAPEHRGIGMLFQEGALWPHMSVERTLAFTLKHCGHPKLERAARIKELLAQVHLAGFEKRMPATLSGGEAQRVSLARALASNPSVLLLDEPLGPLDTAMREELCELLKRLHQELGFTALHVTHDQSEPARLDARALEMKAGLWMETSS